MTNAIIPISFIIPLKTFDIPTTKVNPDVTEMVVQLKSNTIPPRMFLPTIIDTNIIGGQTNGGEVSQIRQALEQKDIGKARHTLQSVLTDDQLPSILQNPNVSICERNKLLKMLMVECYILLDHTDHFINSDNIDGYTKNIAVSRFRDSLGDINANSHEFNIGCVKNIPLLLGVIAHETDHLDGVTYMNEEYDPGVPQQLALVAIREFGGDLAALALYSAISDEDPVLFDELLKSYFEQRLVVQGGSIELARKYGVSLDSYDLGIGTLIEIVYAARQIDINLADFIQKLYLSYKNILRDYKQNGIRSNIIFSDFLKDLEGNLQDALECDDLSISISQRSRITSQTVRHWGKKVVEKKLYDTACNKSYAKDAAAATDVHKYLFPAITLPAVTMHKCSA